MVTHPSTNPTKLGLTLMSGQNIVISKFSDSHFILIKISIWASTLLVLLYFVSYLIFSPRFIPSLHFLPGLQSAFYTWSAFYTRSAVRVLSYSLFYTRPQSAIRFILTASVIVISEEFVGCKIRDIRSRIISVSFKLSR